MSSLDRVGSAGGQPSETEKTAQEPQGVETVSRFRPCLRRAASTLRPPLVFIRARKPCVFLPWRLRGRYVRFMASYGLFESMGY